MVHLLLTFVFLVEALSAAVSPLVSNFGENTFRSGDVVVALRSQSQYNFEVPFSSSLSSGPITLALSMVDYNQTMDSSNKIAYDLLENTPSPSNKTHAVFRVQLGLPFITYRAAVKYLACSTSILSQTFNIVVSRFNPGTLQAWNYYNYTLNTSLNTTSGYVYTIWFSGINVSKSSSGGTLYIYSLLISSNVVRLFNMNQPVYFSRVTVTLIFLGNITTTISGNYRLPYLKGFSSINSFPYSLSAFNSWWDTSNTICGIYDLLMTSNFLEYTFYISGNTVSLQSTIAGLTGPSSEWSYNYCLIAGSKMCPITHPYYDKTTNLCYDACPGQNKYDYLCNYACPSNCTTCSSNIVCTVCSSGYYLRSDNLCYSSCLGGIILGSNICCSQGCATCSSSNTCQKCSSLYYLGNDGLCYTNCPSRFYPEASNSTCVSCPTGCATCSTSTVCQSCSFSYLRPDNLCYSSCPAGFYPDSLNNICVSCPIGCANCSSSEICQLCEPSYYLSNNSTCQPGCSPSEFCITLSQRTVFIICIGAIVVIFVLIVCVISARSESSSNQRENEGPEIPVGSAVNLKLQPSIFAGEKREMGKECAICLTPNCSLLTSCKHNFHIECLVAWAFKNLVCPFCRSGLAGQMIQLFCRSCRVLKGLVTLKSLQEMYGRGIRAEDTLCDSCKLILN